MVQHFFFLVKCPGCGHDMKYHSTTKMVSDNRKRCVYCGRSFRVGDQLLKAL